MFPHSHHLTEKREITLDLMEWIWIAVTLELRGICRYRNISTLELGTAPQQDGEGNGTPLQYSCLENPMDGGA